MQTREAPKRLDGVLYRSHHTITKDIRLYVNVIAIKHLAKTLGQNLWKMLLLFYFFSRRACLDFAMLPSCLCVTWCSTCLPHVFTCLPARGVGGCVGAGRITVPPMWGGQMPDRTLILCLFFPPCVIIFLYPAVSREEMCERRCVLMVTSNHPKKKRARGFYTHTHTRRVFLGEFLFPCLNSPSCTLNIFWPKCDSERKSCLSLSSYVKWSVGGGSEGALRERWGSTKDSGRKIEWQTQTWHFLLPLETVRLQLSVSEE